MNENKDVENHWYNVIELHERVKSKITSDTNLLWTNYNTAEELITEINKIHNLLKNHDKKGLDFLNYWFAPTGTLQEIAMQNDWIQEYLNLSTEFDVLFEKLKS